VAINILLFIYLFTYLLAAVVLGRLDVGDQILGRLHDPLVQVELSFPVSRHLHEWIRIQVHTCMGTGLFISGPDPTLPIVKGTAV